MARHSDDLTDQQSLQLGVLFDDLCKRKPKRWSFVKGLREIVGRPDNRRIGKFSIRFGVITSTEITIGFFSQDAKLWKEWMHCPSSSVDEMLLWMLKIVGENVR